MPLQTKEDNANHAGLSYGDCSLDTLRLRNASAIRQSAPTLVFRNGHGHCPPASALIMRSSAIKDSQVSTFFLPPSCSFLRVGAIEHL